MVMWGMVTDYSVEKQTYVKHPQFHEVSVSLII